MVARRLKALPNEDCFPHSHQHTIGVEKSENIEVVSFGCARFGRPRGDHPFCLGPLLVGIRRHEDEWESEEVIVI